MRGFCIYYFGVLASNVHTAWMRAVTRRLKSDYSYSNTIVYSNFPWPSPTPGQKEKIEKTAQGILERATCIRTARWQICATRLLCAGAVEGPHSERQGRHAGVRNADQGDGRGSLCGVAGADVSGDDELSPQTIPQNIHQIPMKKGCK